MERHLHWGSSGAGFAKRWGIPVWQHSFPKSVPKHGFSIVLLVFGPKKAPWEPFLATWGRCGLGEASGSPSWASLGPFLGPSWPSLSLSWGVPSLSWGFPGPFLSPRGGSLGPSLPVLGTAWFRGCLQGHLRNSPGPHLGRVWGAVGPPMCLV